jgi:hypothetical protein
MNYQLIKTQYDNKMETTYREFRHICENMLNIDMQWDPEIPSNSSLTPDQWEAAELHFANMYNIMNIERDALRQARLTEINIMIDQMAQIVPKMDYSGRTPKECKWVVELRSATLKNEPICLSPFWREIVAVINAINFHKSDMKAKWGVTTTFKL